MQTTIVPIGNSRGIRIPKAMLEQCGFNGRVEMEVKGQSLIISKPKRKPREGWAEQLAAIPTLAKEAYQDHLPDFFGDEEWIEEEWVWPEEKK